MNSTIHIERLALHCYHGVMPQKDVSYSACGLLAESDVARLDELKAIKGGQS